MRYRLLLCCTLALLLMTQVYCACAQTSSLLEPGNILCLVNRETRLDKSLAPDDLIKPKVDTRKESLQDRIFMRPEAAHALEDMFTAALSEKAYQLLAVSGYRSYGEQQVLFNQKAQAVGRAKASLTVAKAGESEHQLGLAMDVQCADTPTLSEDFAETPEGQWVAENAHRFGFIIRYKDEWSDVTGYAYEPWHLRYIGILHATAVYMLDVPYEHYYEQIIRLPAYVIEQGNPYLLSGLVRELMNGNDDVLALLPENPNNANELLSDLTGRFLPGNVTYQQAVWLGSPTPRPTPPPRIDDADEISYESMKGH